MVPSDDAALVTRMQAGDERALGELYDRWEDAVRVCALNVVGDAAEAEDVVEDVFWQAWRQSGRFDASRGTVSAWLLTIARSRSLDRARARKRSRETSALEELEQSGSEAAIAPNGNPLADAERGERSRLLRNALRDLPNEQRESLELAYFEGLSQTEIAERTGNPLGTIKTRMRLAMQKLRDSLSALGEPAT
jgi:RNA polymerase sigma-70 factor (ECF subfamily)